MSENYSIIGMIDKLRERVRSTSDDSKYSDEYFYSILLDIRNDFLYKSISKRKFVPKSLYKTICMPLEKSTVIPCDCIPNLKGNDECVVLKTKYKVPDAVSASTYQMITVTTIDGSTEYSKMDLSISPYRKYMRSNTDKPFLTEIDGYYYLIGYPNNSLKVLLISLVPVDPIELYDIPKCDNSGKVIEDSCLDIRLDTFNIEPKLCLSIIDEAFNKIVNSDRLPEDITNNAQSAALKI